MSGLLACSIVAWRIRLRTNSAYPTVQRHNREGCTEPGKNRCPMNCGSKDGTTQGETPHHVRGTTRPLPQASNDGKVDAAGTHVPVAATVRHGTSMKKLDTTAYNAAISRLDKPARPARSFQAVDARYVCATPNVSSCAAFVATAAQTGRPRFK